jgi:cell wall-associated NlpC family hydrolase
MAQFRGHNEAVLRTLEIGDLVAFKRKYYTHVGVYVGMYQCPLSSCRLSILLAFLFHISFEYSFQ